MGERLPVWPFVGFQLLNASQCSQLDMMNSEEQTLNKTGVREPFSYYFISTKRKDRKDI
jgi:hypothetical protein